MLKRRIIRKLFISTVSIFIIFCAITISNIDISDDKFLVNDYENIQTSSIYLVNKNDYLVKNNIILDDNLENNVLKILDNLYIRDINKYNSEFRGVLDSSIKVLDVFCGKSKVTINFSKEFYEFNVKEMVSAIVYSILDIPNIKNISILVEGELLKGYPEVLDKSIGINTQYDIKSLNNINSVLIYFLENVDDDVYYVPVTKYVNDERDKIKIIIEELTTSYIHDVNLASYLNSKTRLIDYKLDNDMIILNFNDYLFDSNGKILEEVIYSISYSVFDNYDVSLICFEVNNEKITQISRNFK